MAHGGPAHRAGNHPHQGHLPDEKPVLRTQKADEFQQNIGGKLDQLIQSMTEIKGEIDNVTVSMLNGDESMGASDEGAEGSDIDSDFGEFNADEGSEEDLGGEEDFGAEEGSDEGSLDDLAAELEPVGREEK